MKTNKIEEAATYYAEENSMDIEDQMGDTYDGIEELSDAYKAGAKWVINEFLKDLWHPASEIPCEGKYLVVEYNVTDTIKDYLSFKRLEGYLGWNWISYCKSTNVTQWLYVDDLLPKKRDNHD